MDIDHAKDTGDVGLAKLVGMGVKIPSFVCDGQVADDKDAEMLDKHAFADVRNGLYPIHTAEDTWLSAAYFHKLASKKDSAVATRLEEAASVWDLDISELKVAIQKQASAPLAELAYIQGGQVIEKVAARSAEDFVAVADHALTREMPFECMHKLAHQVLRAEARGLCELDRDRRVKLEKMAGLGRIPAEGPIGALRSLRARCAQKSEVAPEYIDKIASVLTTEMTEVNGRYFLSSEGLEKFATSMEAAKELMQFSDNDPLMQIEPESFVEESATEEAERLEDELPLDENGEIIVKKSETDSMEKAASFLRDVIGLKFESLDKIAGKVDINYARLTAEYLRG